MKIFNWNPEKNEKLKKEREISFEEIVEFILEKKLIDVVKHPNIEKYPNQKVFVIDVNGYCYLVPFVENDEEIFFKTIIPSRKATSQYLRGDKNE